jgi:uncharacterized protein
MSDPRRRALFALLLLVPAPTLGSLLAYQVAPGVVGQTLYMLLRVWIATWPLIWLLRVERGSIAWSPLAREHRKEALWGTLALSASITLAVVGVWHAWGRELLDAEQLRAVVSAAGMATPARYLLFGTFIALVNSLMEEYVWRWFVYRRCEELVGGLAAVPLSALCFTSHHVVTFGIEFGASAGLLASCGVFLAGCIWSACYLRWRSIWPGWVSHVVADVVGLAIGWKLLFG